MSECLLVSIAILSCNISTFGFSVCAKELDGMKRQCWSLEQLCCLPSVLWGSFQHNRARGNLRQTIGPYKNCAVYHFYCGA
jgi:hypothetical protein